MTHIYRSHGALAVGYASRKPALFAALAYLLASLLLTWPLIFELDFVLFGDYGDSRARMMSSHSLTGWLKPCSDGMPKGAAMR